MSTHDATFYVQVQPDLYGYAGTSKVRSISAVRLTQKRPQTPIGGSVMVKLTVRIPDSAFLPLQPEAVIVVSEDMIVGTPVTIEAITIEAIEP